MNASVTDAKGKTHDFPITTLGRQGKNHFLKQLRAKAKGKLSRIALTGEIHVGKVPPFSVVAACSLPSNNLPGENYGPSLYCAVIVKQVDEKTRGKVGINELLRSID